MKSIRIARMEFLYPFLQKAGFGHPLHPAMVHAPIGLVIGAFVFMLVALVLKRETYPLTALRCGVVSLIMLVPAAFFGFTDWQHFYAGAWSFAIKVKIALTALLAFLLLAAIVMETKKMGTLFMKAAVYGLCVAAVAVLGYFGAELVYPGKGQGGGGGSLEAGEKLYATHCAGCHPGGGNTLMRGITVSDSVYLKDVSAFTRFNRMPLRPDGSKGLMPAYPEVKISNHEMALIYEYVTRVLVRER